jgi:hypothetical protein
LQAGSASFRIQRKTEGKSPASLLDARAKELIENSMNNELTVFFFNFSCCNFSFFVSSKSKINLI